MTDHPNRRWDDAHRDANYHQQEWAHDELHPEHPVCGHHLGRDGTHLVVRHLASGPTGAPELELEWATGRKVTVLDATVAQKYVDQHKGR